MNNNHIVDLSPQQSSIAMPAPGQAPENLGDIPKRQLLTDIEVAEYLSISISTVRRWRLKGGGPRWIRIGSSIRHHATELHAYIVSLPSGGGTKSRVN